MQEKNNQRGKVIKSTRNQYLVDIAGKTVNCTIRGKLAGAPGSPDRAVKVGDNVRVHLVTESEGVIEKILPRHSRLSRAVEGKAYREHTIAVNVDQIVIIMAAREPAFKSGLLDRYLVIAEKNELHAVVCINKIDLADKKDFESYANWYPKLNYPLFFTSVETREGVREFQRVLQRKVSVLVGHSGVGKSSLLNAIEPGLDLRVADISDKTSKGKHTTTHVQLFPLSFGGYVIDTPGIRELGLWDLYRDELREYFVEFRAVEQDCQFNDCRHLKEPGCAVKEAVESGGISAERYQNYCNIYRDLRAAHYELIKRR